MWLELLVLGDINMQQGLNNIFTQQTTHLSIIITCNTIHRIKIIQVNLLSFFLMFDSVNKSIADMKIMF